MFTAVYFASAFTTSLRMCYIATYDIFMYRRFKSDGTSIGGSVKEESSFILLYVPTMMQAKHCLGVMGDEKSHRGVMGDQVQNLTPWSILQALDYNSHQPLY